MVRICIFAVITAVVHVSPFGCGQHDAGNTPSRSTEQATTSPRESPEPRPNSEATAIPVEFGVLECPNGNALGGIIDYAAEAKGKKGTPVEIARREFSKKIREGDTVEISDRSGGQNATATVRVIREGRVVALIQYRRAGGGWLQDSYDACSSF